MNKANPILSKADRLHPGGYITIRLASFTEMESLRVSLSRTAAKYYPDLKVSRDASNNSIKISKPDYDLEIHGILDPEPEPLISPASVPPQLERIISAMREDNLSEEDIKAYIDEFNASQSSLDKSPNPS